MPVKIWLAIVLATLVGACCLGVSTYNSVVRYSEAVRTMKGVK